MRAESPEVTLSGSISGNSTRISGNSTVERGQTPIFSHGPQIANVMPTSDWMLTKRV